MKEFRLVLVGVCMAAMTSCTSFRSVTIPAENPNAMLQVMRPDKYVRLTLQDDREIQNMKILFADSIKITGRVETVVKGQKVQYGESVLLRDVKSVKVKKFSPLKTVALVTCLAPIPVVIMASSSPPFPNFMFNGNIHMNP